MPTSRRQGREQEVLGVLIAQGAVIPCFRCRVAFTTEDHAKGNIEKEHLHELELEGPDEPRNWRFSHKAKPCHATVTHGNGATVAGSSRHRIAKATDPKRIEKFQVQKRPLDRPPAIDPGIKCRRCGEWGEDCQCPVPMERSSFGRARP
jgi:hypothetical protein